MKQPDRPAQTDVGATDYETLSTNTAQSRKCIPRSETSAVDNRLISSNIFWPRRTCRPEHDLNVQPSNLIEQESKRCWRFDVSFLSEIKCRRKASGQIRLKFTNLRFIELLIALRHTRETHQLRSVSRTRNDQAT